MKLTALIIAGGLCEAIGGVMLYSLPEQQSPFIAASAPAPRVTRSRCNIRFSSDMATADHVACFGGRNMHLIRPHDLYDNRKLRDI